MAFTFAAFCYMLTLVLCASLIFFVIWHIIAFDELRTDFKNPIDQGNPARARERLKNIERICCLLRKLVVPEYSIHGLFCLMFLCAAEWVTLGLNIPLLFYHLWRRLRGHVRRRLHHERRHPQLLSEGVLVQTGLLPALLLLLSVQYGLYVGEFLKGEAGQGVKPENGPDSCVPHPRGPLGQQRTSSAPAPPNCCYGMARPSPPPHLGPCQSGASQRPPAAAPTWKAYYYGRDLESSPALGLTGRQERDRARERGTGPLPLPEQATNHPFGPFPATPGRPPGFGKLAREAEPRGGEGREQAQPGAPPQPHLPLPALPLPFPPSLFSALSSVFPLCHAPRPRPCLSLYPGFLRRWGSGPFQRLGEFVCKTQVSLGQSWPFVTE